MSLMMVLWFPGDAIRGVVSYYTLPTVSSELLGFRFYFFLFSFPGRAPAARLSWLYPVSFAAHVNLPYRIVLILFVDFEFGDF